MNPTKEQVGYIDAIGPPLQRVGLPKATTREAEQRLGPVEDIKDVFEQAQEALYSTEAG